MKYLFHERGWGRQQTPKAKHSDSGSKGRPEFMFDFCAVHGISRQNIERWPIKGFSEQSAQIGLSAFASWAKRPLMAVETDWINLALAIYSADRFASRRPAASAGDRYWRRAISLKVAVADPPRWQRVKSSILHALSFLTDDDWELDFTKREISFGEEMQTQFQDQSCESPSWICLFSGGLDSLAGFKHLSDHVGGKGLLISGSTNERLSCGQEELISKLPGQRGYSHDWLQIRYGFPRIQNTDLMESSQRSRGWVHVALGLTALVVSNHEILDVCENGIGALNLPTEFSQTGSHTSRAVHPVFLSRIAKAATLLFERKLSIRQPALFETKGELLERVFNAGDSDLIKASFSCEIFPNYNAKQPQCGVCPSCLVRRSALSYAGLADPATQYSFDALSKAVTAKKALGMIKMERYVRRIETCFGQSARDDAALWEYPESGSYFSEAADSLNMSLDEFLSGIRRLHHAFAEEWKDFSEKLPHRKQITEMAA